MGYEDLPLIAQNLIITNNEFVIKLLLIFGLILFCLYYVTVIHKQTQTPYLIIGFVKVFFYAASWAILFFSPFYLMMLNPNFPLETMYLYLSMSFLVVSVVIFVYLLVNLVYVSPIYMLKKAGLKIDGVGGNKLVNKIDEMLGYKKIKEVNR